MVGKDCIGGVKDGRRGHPTVLLNLTTTLHEESIPVTTLFWFIFASGLKKRTSTAKEVYIFCSAVNIKLFLEILVGNLSNLQIYSEKFWNYFE